MALLIGVSAAWSNETWGEEAANPHGYVYTGKPYTDVIYRCGAVPVVLAPPLDGAPGEALFKAVEAVLDRVGGLILSGGGGATRFKPENMPGLQEQQPLRYLYETALLREARRRRLPLLGFCRGHQMIAEVAGGIIKREPVAGHQQDPAEKTAHSVELLPGSRLAEIIGARRWEVNSYHCQVVETAPPGFAVCARSPEGWIEAIEAVDRNLFWLGCQFHPELMIDADPKARRIFDHFIAAAKNRAE